jgi:hypothetical protein
LAGTVCGASGRSLIIESPPSRAHRARTMMPGVVQRQVWRVEEHDLPELSVDVQAECRYGGVEGHVHTSTGMHGRRNRHRMS